MTTSPRTGRFSAQRRFDYRRLVAVFDSYVQTGRVDLSVRRRGGGGPRPTGAVRRRLTPRGKRTWPNAVWRGDARGLRAGGPRLPVFLESRGIFELDAADGGTVLAFLASLSPRWAKTSLFWVVSNFRPFLAFTGRADLVDAVNLAGVKRSHPIVPVLGDDDQRLVVTACASGMVCARDAAITLLALSTGLRACDIVGLRLGDVDWRGRRSPSCSARRATR